MGMYRPKEEEFACPACHAYEHLHSIKEPFRWSTGDTKAQGRSPAKWNRCESAKHFNHHISTSTHSDSRNQRINDVCPRCVVRLGGGTKVCIVCYVLTLRNVTPSRSFEWHAYARENGGWILSTLNDWSLTQVVGRAEEQKFDANEGNWINKATYVAPQSAIQKLGNFFRRK